MTALYLDGTTGDDGDNGTTWALAKATLGGVLAVASAGDIIFAMGNTTDTVGATETSPGTSTNPVIIVGVASGTTAAPPLDADIAERGVDTLWNGTASGDLTLSGYAICYNIELGPNASTGDMILDANSSWKFVDCKIPWGDDLRAANTAGLFEFSDCEMAMVSGSVFDLQGGVIECWNCTFTGTPTNLMVSNNQSGILNIAASDLTVFSGDTLVIMTGMNVCRVKIDTCKMPTSVTLTSGVPDDQYSRVDFVASTDDTGLGEAVSIRNQTIKSLAGTLATEFTATRVGGANDGGSGDYSWALTPNVDSTLESVYGIATPWIEGWVEGDGSTITLQIAIANDGAADYKVGDVGLELYAPDNAGDAQHVQVYDNARVVIVPAAPADLTDDIASSWGVGADNHQRLIVDDVALAPDFQGSIFARVIFYKRFALSPETLFVDPKLEVG